MPPPSTPTRPSFAPTDRVSSLPYGDYDKEPINFSKHASTCFRPTLVTKRESLLFSMLGCGLSAVYTMTGVPAPELVEKCLRANIDFSKGTTGEQLIWLLKEYGYTAIPITLRDVCPKRKLIEELITDQHVLLCAQWVAKDELSWFVAWDNFEFHNFVIRPVSNQRILINNPLDQVILVHHSSWEAELPAFPNERLDTQFRNPTLATQVFQATQNLRVRMARLREQIQMARIDAKGAEMKAEFAEMEKIQRELTELTEQVKLFK